MKTKPNIKIYADGADMKGMLELNASPIISGLTTNPTLMRKAGITDYEGFAKSVLSAITQKPLSLEVFSDDFEEMARQAERISSWGSNVYVKIPITNSQGHSSQPLIRHLATKGVKLNITAIMTQGQVEETLESISPAVPSVISVFAGRIADTGVDPMDIMRNSALLVSEFPKAELLWASVREVINIHQAAEAGCHIVTVPHDILQKALKMSGMNLLQLSLETVRMFKTDAEAAGYSIVT